MKARICLPLAVLSLGGCGASQTAAPPPSEGPQAVDVAPAKAELLATKLPLPAQLVPYESVDLYPRVAGFVEEVTVDRGSQVRKGQLLVRLSAPEVVAQARQAAAARGAADAKLAADKATYERLANAAKTEGAVAANELNIARELTASDAAQAAAAAQAAKAAKDLGAYLEIRAPFDGVVTARNTHPGALAGPTPGAGPPLLQLVTPHRLRLVVATPEDDVLSAKVGQDLAFTVPADPGQVYHAPIARIAQAVDPKTRTMMVEADVRNADGALAPGAFATVQWPVQRAKPTLRVPSSAVANDQERQFVIKVSGGAAHWVDVKTGMTVDGAVEVFGALQPGDLVVKRGTDAIKDGTKIRANPIKPATGG